MGRAKVSRGNKILCKILTFNKDVRQNHYEGEFGGDNNQQCEYGYTLEMKRNCQYDFQVATVIHHETI